MKQILFIITFIFLLLNLSFAQQNEGGLPYSILHDTIFNTETIIVSAPMLPDSIDESIVGTTLIVRQLQ